jgi:hypothetical protein
MMSKATRTNVFNTLADAEGAANAANAEPLKQGQESRVPFKVYEVVNGDKKVFAVATAPQPAAYYGMTSVGVSIELAGSAKPLMPLDTYFSKLTPEQLEEARKFLGAK